MSWTVYLPDWAWYIHNWIVNNRRLRERYPNPVKCFRYQRRLRKAWRS